MNMYDVCIYLSMCVLRRGKAICNVPCSRDNCEQHIFFSLDRFEMEENLFEKLLQIEQEITDRYDPMHTTHHIILISIIASLSLLLSSFQYTNLIAIDLAAVTLSYHITYKFHYIIISTRIYYYLLIQLTFINHRNDLIAFASAIHSIWYANFNRLITTITNHGSHFQKKKKSFSLFFSLPLSYIHAVV